MQWRASCRNIALKCTIFWSENDEMVQKIETGKIRKVMRASSLFLLCQQKAAGVGELFQIILRDLSLLTKSVKEGAYVQFMIHSEQHYKFSTFSFMWTVTLSEVTLFMRSRLIL